MTGAEPCDPNWRRRVEAIFTDAAFVRSLGIRALSIAPGAVEADLLIRAEHLQQDGYVHAGVQATLADHSAGAAAATLVEDGVLA